MSEQKLTREEISLNTAEAADARYAEELRAFRMGFAEKRTKEFAESLGPAHAISFLLREQSRVPSLAQIAAFMEPPEEKESRAKWFDLEMSAIKEYAEWKAKYRKNRIAK